MTTSGDKFPSRHTQYSTRRNVSTSAVLRVFFYYKCFSEKRGKAGTTQIKGLDSKSHGGIDSK